MRDIPLEVFAYTAIAILAIPVAGALDLALGSLLQPQYPAIYVLIGPVIPAAAYVFSLAALYKSLPDWLQMGGA